MGYLVVGKRRDGFCLYGLIKRDGCCGMLSVHHIKTRGSGGDDDPKNLITLCQKHHDEAQSYKIPVADLHAILTRFYGYEYEAK